MAEEEKQSQLLELADWIFLLGKKPTQDSALKATIKARLVELSAAETARCLCPWALSAEELVQVEQKNAEELKSLEDKIQDAVTNLGESEVREAIHNKAKFLDRIGKKDEALAIYEETLNKSVHSSHQIDILFDVIKMGMFWGDAHLVSKYIGPAKEMVEKGGDWEKRNMLKVYEGVYLMMIREFKKASVFFLDSIATFTCSDLFPYKRFILYTVILAVVSIDRVELRKKVIESPDVISVIGEIPYLQPFLQSFYSGNYSEFMKALAGIMDAFAHDRYIHSHYSYYVREIRIVAYLQFLQPFKSVTLQTMATSFGLTPEFLDS
jgi:26S proteasome regulatory subunit N7